MGHPPGNLKENGGAEQEGSVLIRKGGVDDELPRDVVPVATRFSRGDEMWLLTPAWLFSISIVEKSYDRPKASLTVRARVKERFAEPSKKISTK